MEASKHSMHLCFLHCWTGWGPGVATTGSCPSNIPSTNTTACGQPTIGSLSMHCPVRQYVASLLQHPKQSRMLARIDLII